MSIRTRIFGPGADEPLLSIKRSKGAKADALNSVSVPRAECRRGNLRGCDRHRLAAEQAILRRNGEDHFIELVNLSAGGAMVRCEIEMILWDHVGLVLGDDGELECAVRWIKDGQVGLEFAHETRIDCDQETRDDLLRAVIRKSFPELQGDPLQSPERRAEDDPDAEAGSGQRRAAERHPLVWRGVVYHDYEVEPVRLRNISVTGALVQSSHDLPEGATVYLEVGRIGKLEATVRWSRGGQSGLAFTHPFDIHSLSNASPTVTENATHAEAFGNQAPWAPGWRRATMEQMARSLSG